MVLWLNGPFGVGKTSVALELQARLPDSFIFDPEELGFAIRKLTPPQQQREDFQEYPLWREFVGKTLVHACEAGTTLIVPMTVVNTAYFEEIVGGLRGQGVLVKHIVLLAPKETLLRRLEQRGDDRQSWPAKQLERCLAGLASFPQADYFSTEGLGVREVADSVAARLGL